MANTFPTAPPGTCPIQKIPLEVLLRISYYLSTPDLGRLRLTSRSIEQALYTTFVDEFFTRKQFMITQESLQALIDMSKSRLSKHLRFVHFGLNRFFEEFNPVAEDEKEDRLRRRISDIFTLWNTGHHRDMMAEAFRNLENLEDVIIRDSDSRRPRDGPHAKWRSCGYTTALNETGDKMKYSDTFMRSVAGLPCRYSSQVFTAVIYALGTAQARPKGIDIMLTDDNSLTDHSLNIPDFLQPSVVPILEGLEKLHLCIRVPFAPPPFPPRLIQEFLPHATNLKSLRINEVLSHAAIMGDFFDWIAGDLDYQASTDGTKQGDLVVSMPRLEKLSLGTMCVDAPRLLKLAWKFAPSLKSLELRRVTLFQEAPPDMQTMSKPEESFWDPFLKDLTEIPGLDLEHFKADMLGQRYDSDHHNATVSFKGYGDVCEYNGSDWKRFIGEIRPLLDVEWQPINEDESIREGTDYEDTDDEEEDTSMLDDEDDAAGDDE